MDAKKKIGLAIGALLLVVAGVAFAKSRKKSQGEDLTPGSSTPEADKTSQPKSPTTAAPVKASSATPKKKAVKKPTAVVPGGSTPASTVVPGVKADDVLSYDINGANSKPLYANTAANVYNMASSVAFKASKGQFLGAGTEARASGSAYIIYFMRGNVKYWIPSGFVNITP